MSRVRVLDLFCGAGGAGAGYHAAGCEVVGVDIAPQPNYPFDFIEGDALAMIRGMKAACRTFDLIHASPPCQGYTRMNAPGKKDDHPLLIPAVRECLIALGVPFVIENVEGAPLIEPVMLCGSMFGLGADGHQLRRHRLFETSFPVVQPVCQHTSPVIGVYGDHVRCRAANHGGRGTRDFVGKDKPKLAATAIGIDHPCTMREISEAIPPAYTRWLAIQFALSGSMRAQA